MTLIDLQEPPRPPRRKLSAPPNMVEFRGKLLVFFRVSFPSELWPGMVVCPTIIVASTCRWRSMPESRSGSGWQSLRVVHYVVACRTEWSYEPPER